MRLFAIEYFFAIFKKLDFSEKIDKKSCFLTLAKKLRICKLTYGGISEGPEFSASPPAKIEHFCTET